MNLYEVFINIVENHIAESTNDKSCFLKLAFILYTFKAE